MALGDPYVTQAELSSYIASVDDQASISVTHRGTELTAAATAASRAIERFCDRQFNAAAASTARVYRASNQKCLRVDDFSALTTLKTDTGGDGTYDATWAATDYQLEPLNNVVNGQTGWPYYIIRAVGTRSFPLDNDGQVRVELDATWGWSAVPDAVKQACFIKAHRLYRRASTPEGVAGFGLDGAAVRLTAAEDGDVMNLLSSYVRVERFV